uniref:RING-type domain-containing protein n=1 Tax=Steinernema glaseri TaxID=37863 RepID=A0A1I8AAX2_9BILA
MPSARSRAVNSSQGEASSSSQMRILATRRSIHGTHRALANEEMARMRERLATMRQSYRLHAPPRNLGHISQYVPISMNDSSSDVPQLTIPLVSLDEVGPLDESRADDDESDDLKCPICFDVFGDPKILPCCGHSICSNCEVNVMSRGDYNNFSCPVCGTRGTLRIGSLKLNYSLKEAMTILKKTRQEKVDCEGCEKSIILTEVFWCKSCHPEDKKKICSHCGFKDHRGHDIERFQFMEADTRKQKIDELKDYVGWLDDSFLHRDIIAVHKLYKTMRTETAMATTRLANNNCVSQEEF